MGGPPCRAWEAVVGALPPCRASEEEEGCLSRALGAEGECRLRPGMAGEGVEGEGEEHHCLELAGQGEHSACRCWGSA